MSKSGNTYNTIEKYSRHGLSLEEGQIANLEISFATWQGAANFYIAIVAYQNSYDTGITFQTLSSGQMRDSYGFVQRNKWENINSSQKYLYGLSHRTSHSVSIKCLKDGDKYKYIINGGGADITLIANGDSLYWL